VSNRILVVSICVLVVSTLTYFHYDYLKVFGPDIEMKGSSDNMVLVASTFSLIGALVSCITTFFGLRIQLIKLKKSEKPAD